MRSEIWKKAPPGQNAIIAEDRARPSGTRTKKHPQWGARI